MSREKSKQKQKSKVPSVLVPPQPWTSASRWNFHERSDRGVGVISKWIADAGWSAKTRANLDRAIDQLRSLPKQRWSKPSPASKIGDHTYVIRFKEVTSTQLRIFGHFFDGHRSFAMTMEGFEKDNVYYPENYENVAQGYRTLCDKDFKGSTLPFEDRCAICPNDGDRH